MGRFLSTIFFLWIAGHTAFGQLELKFENQSATVLNFNSFPDRPLFDAISLPSETEYEKLFKSYFNPSSFEKYKSFFLPADWGGFSQQEFDEWQSRIRKDKLYLNYGLHVRTADGKEFIICQYTMESDAYSIPESVKFKKVLGSWKHIHVRNDEAFMLLHQIGNLSRDYLENALQQSQAKIQVDQVPGPSKVMLVEKFNREQVFERIETILTESDMSANDISIARNFFLQKEDQAFVEWVTSISGNYDLDFMEMLNDKAGIKLFNFTKAQNE